MKKKKEFKKKQLVKLVELLDKKDIKISELDLIDDEFVFLTTDDKLVRLNLSNGVDKLGIIEQMDELNQRIKFINDLRNNKLALLKTIIKLKKRNLVMYDLIPTIVISMIVSTSTAILIPVILLAGVAAVKADLYLYEDEFFSNEENFLKEQKGIIVKNTLTDQIQDIDMKKCNIPSDSNTDTEVKRIRRKIDFFINQKNKLISNKTVKNLQLVKSRL